MSKLIRNGQKRTSPTRSSKTGAIGLILKFTLEKLPGDLILFDLTLSAFILFSNVHFIVLFLFVFLFSCSRVKSNFYVNKALLPSGSTHVLSLHKLRLSPLIY